ncbi:MAG: PTS sugar transporter subunit IIA [Pyrinomonadaceae bacterium]
MGKVGGVIISHGQVGKELQVAAEALVGELSFVTAVSIGWHDDVELARGEIERAIQRVDSGRGVLLLTDMFGGTPTNIAAMFLRVNEVEVVTGVNLPMVVKLATANEEVSLHDLAKEIESQGKESILRAGTLLEPRRMTKDA